MSAPSSPLIRRALTQARIGCLDLTIGSPGNAIRILEETFGFSVFLLWPTPAHIAKPYWREKLPPIRGPDGKPVEERVRKVLSQALEASRLRFEGEQGFPNHEDEDPLLATELITRFRLEELDDKEPYRQDEINRDLTCFLAFLEYEGKLGIAAEDVDVPLLQRFWRLRKSGEIDAYGRRVEKKGDRRPVSARTASGTIATLGQVFNWGMTLREGGENLLTWNPVKAMERPSNKNPTRVVCSDEKFEKILKVADQIMVGHGDEKRRAPLREIWIVAGYTGHRRGAILKLRWEDWRPDVGKHGALLWRAESDKTEKEHMTPVMTLVHNALEGLRREHMANGLGGEWIFPAFESDGHVRGDVVHGWVLEAEKLAGYEKHEPYFGLHSLRRRWAMKRKHLSPVDVAELGGWSNVDTLQQVYQRADLEAMERVLVEGEKYRLG